jgi:hypothetical protein
MEYAHLQGLRLNRALRFCLGRELLAPEGMVWIPGGSPAGALFGIVGAKGEDCCVVGASGSAAPTVGQMLSENSSCTTRLRGDLTALPSRELTSANLDKHPADKLI